MSNNGKWRSFPKVPHLLQYVISGNYFGKVKINGKSIRKSLETSVWTTAQLRLNDFLKEHRENRNKVDPPKFKEAVELLKGELEGDSTMKPRSKEYRLGCIQKLERTWPELWELRLNEITPNACKDWAAKLHKEISGQYYNNVIGTLRLVIQMKCGFALTLIGFFGYIFEPSHPFDNLIPAIAGVLIVVAALVAEKSKRLRHILLQAVTFLILDLIAMDGVLLERNFTAPHYAVVSVMECLAIIWITFRSAFITSTAFQDEFVDQDGGENLRSNTNRASAKMDLSDISA